MNAPSLPPIRVRALGGAAILAAAVYGAPAHALQFAIANGAAQIYLRVGATGGTVSIVNFNLAGQAGILGSGTPISGTVAASAGAASAQTANFPACPANQVRIVARARAPAGAPRIATLQVTAPANLVHAASGNTIPFSEVGWISSEPVDIPSGTFAAGATVILRNNNINTSQEIGTCNLFQFLNASVYPGSVGGTGYYQGTVTYNLVMP
jgi:hypothetical protein